jgi:hypothetical protein
MQVNALHITLRGIRHALQISTYKVSILIAKYNFLMKFIIESKKNCAQDIRQRYQGDQSGPMGAGR